MNKAENVVNINKSMVTGSDVNNNWSALLKGSGQIVEITYAE